MSRKKFNISTLKISTLKIHFSIVLFYTCIIFVLSSYFIFLVAPGSVPVISVTPITLTVLEGEQALFECTAEGDPTPTIRWSRENGRLPQFSSSENGLLIISSTNLEDGGAYVCTAANAIGADGFLVTLTVKRGIVKNTP